MESPSFTAAVRKKFDQLARRNGGPVALVVLGLLLVIGLGLRIGFAVDAPSDQPPDSRAYEQIAANLYANGSFDARPLGAQREVQPSSAYSPGLPLFAAGAYELTGGVHLTLVRILLALLGAGAIPLTYLLGKRLVGPVAGLIGAGAIAIYPALLEYQGLLLTEPLAAFLLCAALVAFFKATDRPASLWPWAGTGALFGALALVRPEYLTVSLLLPIAWLLWEARCRAFRPALPAAAVCVLATLLVIAPWTVRNAIVLDRFVPISTGGGKVLFIGTYLDADGNGPQLRELLLDRRPALRDRFEAGGPVNNPDRLILERVLARVAAERYPELGTDEALGRLGRQNLESDITDHPVEFAGLLASKAFGTWADAPRASMQRLPWRALQIAILVFALAGLVILIVRRRFEALAIGLVLLYVTAIGAILIASPRRELVVLPVLAALAGVGATACGDSLARWRR
ncbi:MAG: glycosyltransferase family 39 protein [Solirubrobacterales bacterium]